MRQIRILHVSDVHFGRHHRCRPEDPTHSRAGYPSIFELIAKDLSGPVFDHPAWKPGSEKSPNPLLVMLTGDLTETAAPEEFKAAHAFLSQFDGAKILGTALSRRDVFVVPGNHDVTYDADEPETRLAPYANFYTKLFSGVRPGIAPDQAKNLTQVHVDQERGTMVAEINSAYYVKKGTADAQRGNVDMESISRLHTALSSIPITERNRMVRIAIMHHHPVLVPDLVEPGRGYDAVANSSHLLKLLREFGFQLVLHGHKHYPHVFSYDSDSPWHETIPPSMLVAAGGSSSSRELPPGGRRCNSYNLISMKWHPEASQARIRFVTRGLIAEDGGAETAPHLWKWVTLREVDRRLYPLRDPPSPARPVLTESFPKEAEAERKAEYQKTRLNMVVSDVLPSLVPGQAYEVRAWIVPHAEVDGTPKPGWEPPTRVVWSAGEAFGRRQECRREDDARFCCGFNYWGPMLVQAEMFFADGRVARAYTYARIPGLEPQPGWTTFKVEAKVTGRSKGRRSTKKPGQAKRLASSKSGRRATRKKSR